MTVEYYVRLILTLAVFAAALYAILRFTKSLKLKKYSGEIKVVDRLQVDTGVAVLIVKVRDRELLLGVSGKDVRLLQSL